MVDSAFGFIADSMASPVIPACRDDLLHDSRPQQQPPSPIADVHELLNHCRLTEALELLRASESRLAGTFLWHRTLGFIYGRQFRAVECLRELERAAALSPYDTLTAALRNAVESVHDQSQRSLRYVVDHVWDAFTYLPAARLSTTDNERLREHVVELKSLDWQEGGQGQAMQDGWQTDEVFDGEDPGLKKLESSIRAVASELLSRSPNLVRELGVSATSPFSLKLWALVIPTSGFQSPHTHPFADISGVYYIRMPEGVSGTDQGALRFVTHPPEFTPPGFHAGEEHLFRPSTGSMVMFPSHLWHSTIPFAVDDLRICVAFDLIFSR